MRKRFSQTSAFHPLACSPDRHCCQGRDSLALNRRLSHGGLIVLLWISFIPLTLWGALPEQPAARQTLAQAKRALIQGNYPHAVELYRQALEQDPHNTDGLLGLAKASLLAGKFKSALATYRSLLRRDPHNTAALTGLGESYNFLGRYADAERPLEQALSADPANATAPWALSRTYFYEHRFQHAERLLKGAVAKRPNDYRLWESLGEVQLEEGHRAEARRNLKRALQLNPQARRPHLLVQHLETQGLETPIKFEFHHDALWLSDGVGNQILTLPQTLSFNYGARWHNQLTGDYRRLAFHNASIQGAPASEAGEAGSGFTLATGMFLV
ncbi:MAG TPA: tetratricopeptide repeat protein, partial [Blastocatellia bacterium]|nr:tetratricopeptide repeat protein [Blastocatellia bacterium]